MKEYLSLVKKKTSEGFLAKFVQVPKKDNEQVDRLAKATLAKCMTIVDQVLSFAQYSLPLTE